MPYIGVFSGLLITSLISLYLFLAHLRGRQLLLSQQKVKQEQALKKEAVEENLSKSRFLRAASHDLRQPLNTLSIYTHLLENKLKNDPETTKLIESIKISAQSLNTMFNSLLDLGRLEGGQLQPKISNFKVEDLLIKLEQEFTVLAKEKNFDFCVNIETGIVTSDPDFLERILRNLLSNVIRYTAMGKVGLEAIVKGEELRLQVVDTGVGFDKKTQGKLFEEFYREELNQSSNDKGLGLGLSIVSHTASLLGHEIGADSIKGKGSSFYIDVPFEAS